MQLNIIYELPEAPLARPSGLSRRHSGRHALLLLVVALHMAVVALLYLPRAGHGVSVEPPAIAIRIITDAPSHREAPPPPPRLTLAPRHIELIVPEIVITESPAIAPVAAPASAGPSTAAASVTNAAPGPTAPISPPRFDAAYLKNPPPLYPAASRRTREQGTVLLRVRVSPQGTALDVLIEQTSGAQRLDEAATEAVRHWRFVPAHRGTDPVEAWVLVPVEFELRR